MLVIVEEWWEHKLVKGFINYRDGRIPFVIEDYTMELFTDDDLLKDFSAEHNKKINYILFGQCFGMSGFQPQKISILVDYSMGNTCYLLCYLINRMCSYDDFDTIGFQSPFLDDIFRYRYNYLDEVRAGTNLSVTPKDIYTIPFCSDKHNYDLIFRIGHDDRMGLLGDIDKKGEIIVQLNDNSIQECYTLSRVLQRFVTFMVSHADVFFKRITLYKGKMATGCLYSKSVLEDAVSGCDVLFCEFDVEKYVPKILNNIALDSGSRITHSVPLGHLERNNFPYTPQRFIEQVIAFEYLFEKLEPQKAKDRAFPLKKELKCMFDIFADVVSNGKISSDDMSERIKEVRRNITHGYSYYYDFKDDSMQQYMVIQLDRLIKAMSMKLIGFSGKEISDFVRF